MTTRLIPPAVGGDTTVYGRRYQCAVGSYLDVPDGDAMQLEANGWTNVGQVGATTGRPTNPKKKDRWFDSTLGYTITFDGLVWRNPNTGASV